MTTAQRHELRRLLGNPPDPANVPESFWRQVERDAQERVAALAYLLFLAAGDFHGGDVDRLRDPALAYGRTRGADAAQRYARGARERFDGLAGRLRTRPPSGRTTPQRGEPYTPDVKPMTQAELEAELLKIFGPSTAERIARTETSKAQTAGGDAGVDDQGADGGTSPDDIWSIRPENSRSGPCANCRALDNVPRSQWATVVLPEPEGDQYGAAGGPPLHDGCVCEIQHASLPVGA